MRYYGTESYGLLMKIKNFTLNGGITTIQRSKRPLRQRINKELNSSNNFIYTNKENALETFLDVSLGEL